jgi:citrate/tricarballylate utilization protein
MMACGFMLCFASTSIGTIYHYFLNLEAPYMYTTLPVILGSSGGVLLLLGCSILLILKLYQDRAPTDSNHDRSSIKFLLLLFLIAFTGLALLILRETVWMGFLLYWHLGLVFSFFLVIPYEKMMHVLFRVVALINAKKVTNES